MIKVNVNKTDVSDQHTAAKLLEKIRRRIPGSDPSFDLEDCDNVLRVESPASDTIEAVIQEIVEQAGHNIEKMIWLFSIIPTITPTEITMTKKETFLQKLNEAFATSDTDYIADNVTDNIRWKIVGDQIIEGKEAFIKALKTMQPDDPMELTLHHIITHGREASVNGVMKIPGEDRSYEFCDVYTFSGFKNPKITEMTSYVIAVNNS